ncbi:MAG: nicotinamide-nucleotide amidohydrolase family protein [Clostridia bacterium]|nr:nicotinamide-nucleotide amidohydrolase family protein [Clostridia bacterium]
MKNCLTIIHNKKLELSGDDTKLFTSYFATHGLYFDRIQYVGYDGGEEIKKSLSDMKSGYNNGVIVCPESLIQTVEKYVESLYGAKFTEGHALHTTSGSVFVTDEHLKMNTPESVCGIISKRFKMNYQTAFIKTVGASVGEIEAALKKADSPGILFRVHGMYLEDTIEILFGDMAPKSQVDDVIRTVAGDLKNYIYAMEDVSLAERLYSLLKLRRMRIAVAESFTGGGIAKRLVDVPGISEVFTEGLNTYSNDSKMLRLGVKKETLSRYGAVSSQTAKEMASGLFDAGLCDIAISTTGIAGPKSDGTKKPVGLCYFGVATEGKVEAFEHHLSGDRKTITETAINKALFLAYQTIK